MMKEPEGLNQTAKVDQVEMKVLRYKETKNLYCKSNGRLSRW